MNSCRRTESLVSLYLEQEASPAEHRFVEQHAARCTQCRETLDRVGALITRLPELPRLETDPDFTSWVLARTHGMRASGADEPGVFQFSRRSVGWAIPVAAAATITLAFLGVRVATRGQDGGPLEVVQGPRSLPEPSHYVPEPASPGGAVVPAPVPELVSFGEGEGQSLGMVRDSYALGTYELRTPADGGTPVLTRVAARDEAPVTVTF